MQRADCANYAYLRNVTPALFDNYYVRMLAGEATYLLPLGSITAAHLHVARTRLAGFKVVATMSNASAAFMGLAGISVSFHDSHRGCKFSPASRAAFMKDNALDTTLFRRVASGNFLVPSEQTRKKMRGARRGS